LLLKLRRDQSVETMTKVKVEIESAGEMVDEKERLASKLQPEIIQWGPLDKLIRRDEELQYVVDEGMTIKKFLSNEEVFGTSEQQKLEDSEQSMT
jgi:hypothetical protein